MKVKELIAKLQEFDGETEVYCGNDEDDIWTIDFVSKEECCVNSTESFGTSCPDGFHHFDKKISAIVIVG